MSLMQEGLRHAIARKPANVYTGRENNGKREREFYSEIPCSFVAEWLQRGLASRPVSQAEGVLVISPPTSSVSLDFWLYVATGIC